MTDFLPDVEKCLEVLNAGGTILYPTDTIWGLGCDATNSAAVEKIFELKQRPGNKSLVVLVADERDILKHVSQLDLTVFDFLQATSKPTTVIYEGAVGLADNVVADDGSAAIRLVSETFCKHLIKRFRKPIVSTSANLSGQPAPAFFSEISGEIINGADYVVHYRQDDTAVATPSSIVKWNKDGSLTTIR